VDKGKTALAREKRKYQILKPQVHRKGDLQSGEVDAKRGRSPSKFRFEKGRESVKGVKGRQLCSNSGASQKEKSKGVILRGEKGTVGGKTKKNLSDRTSPVSANAGARGRSKRNEWFRVPPTVEI